MTRSLKRRLGRLEKKAKGIGPPWWTLPPGEEPDWPRPLLHLSDEALDVLDTRSIARYCDAHEEGREYYPSASELYEVTEAWHELRWRKYGIRRRGGGIRAPHSWVPPTEEDIEEYLETEEGAAVLELLEED